MWLRLLLLLVALLAGCAAGTDNRGLDIPPPEESTSLGAGDVLSIDIVGENLPREYQVASDGSIDVPYVGRLKVAGLEPQEIADLVRKRLVEERVLTRPNVVVGVKEYNSKRISVLGQVAKPGSFPYHGGMTLVEAVSVAGGLSAIANRDKIFLTRRTRQGTRTWVVSLGAISDGRSPDIPLQAGDQLYVNERLF